MSAHAAFSPSGSEKRKICAASFAVEQGLPDSDNAYSSAGTDRHELQKVCLNTGNPADFYLDKRLENGVLVTDEMVEAVQWCVDRVLTYAAGGTMFVEQRVNYAWYVGLEEDEGWGTPDVAIVHPDELTILDSKHGYLDVFASTEISEEVQEFLEAEEDDEAKVEGNRQCMNYALGALNEYGMLGDFKRIRIVILQPAKQRVSEWDCTIEELMKFAEDERAAIARCKEAEALHQLGELKPDSEYFNPDLKACRFCRFAGKCGPLARHCESLGTQRDPVSLSDKELGAAIDAADLVGVWLKAIRAEGERRAFAGQPPIGKHGAYKLVRGKKGNRKFADEEAAEAELKRMRLKKEHIYSFKLKSPTQLEKLLKPNPRKWAKLQPLITQSEGGISLAPATDKRPPYEPPSAADDFEDLTGETSDVLSATA